MIRVLMILVALLNSATLFAQSTEKDREIDKEIPVPMEEIYFKVICPEFKTTVKLEERAAQKLVDQLKEYNAEVKLIGAGVSADDPDYPTKLIRWMKVSYRIAEWQKFAIDLDEEKETMKFLKDMGILCVKLSAEEATEPQQKSTIAKAPVVVNWAKNSVWRGTIQQEHAEMPATVELNFSTKEKFTGELSFLFKSKKFRAKIQGYVSGNKISFVVHEAIEGRVYTPTTYTGELNGTEIKGHWKYTEDQQGEFIIEKFGR